MPSVTPPILWELKADFDNNGIYEADLTPFLKRLEYGIGRENARSSFGPRTLRATLGNQDSRFSPKKLTGPYGANLKRNRRCQLTATPGVTFADRTNLVENPSLETNANGWVLRNGASAPVRDTTKGYYGRCSAKITTANLNQSGALIRRVDGTTRMTVTAGANYVFRLMIAAPVGKSMQVSVRWFDSGGALLVEDIAATVTGRGPDEWFITTLLNLNSDFSAATAELSVHTNGAQGVFDFWADGAYFHFGAGRNPYVDGDQPVCTWAGTAHASQSTRLLADQQDIPQGVWRIRDFNGGRVDMRGRMVLEGTTDEETWMDKLISCGPFTRKRAYLIANRFVDLLEEGEMILDGAHRSTPTTGPTGIKTPEGETYILVGPPATFAYAASGKTAPEDYAAMEGDNVMVIGWAVDDTAGDGWEIDITARTVTGTSYTVACFFATGSSFNDGKRLRFQLWDSVVGVISETTVTLELNEYVYATVEGTFAFAGTRKLRVVAQDNPSYASNSLIWDCLHMVPTANRIARTIGGLDYDIELFPQGGFHRSAVAILEEFARSACAFVYADATGGLTFEQTDTARSDTAAPKARLSDGFDGINYETNGYKEGPTNIYNRARVGSYGAVSQIGSFRRMWALEPGPLVLGANETRVLYADYMTNEGGLMLGRLAEAKAVLTAGTLVADYPLLRGFGSSAEVVVKAGAGGATISELYVEARSQNRGSNEMVFHEETSGAGPISEPKTLKLETPGQGQRTQAMIDLAEWAVNKYVTGPALVGVSVPGGPVGTDDVGIEGWQRVMEIIGRDVGTPVWAKHKNGEGALHLDELYYVEGRTVTQEVKEGQGIGTPKVALKLEEA